MKEKVQKAQRRKNFLCSATFPGKCAAVFMYKNTWDPLKTFLFLTVLCKFNFYFESFDTFMQLFDIFERVRELEP